jgi:hypothetical protein
MPAAQRAIAASTFSASLLPPVLAGNPLIRRRQVYLLERSLALNLRR